MSLVASARPGTPTTLKIFQPLLLLLYFGLVFGALLLPTRRIEYEAAEVASQRQINYEAFYQAEVAPGGRQYAWTRPEVRLFFNDVPRYAPLRFELELNFDRPAGTPPGQLQISEIRSREPNQPIATLNADPQRPGFQTYTLNVPPCTTCETGLTLELKSNGFRPSGDTRSLGVVTDHFGLQLGAGHYRYLLWPLPYAIGVLLTALALISWLQKTRTGWIAGLLWLTPPALCLAIFCPVLYDDSWWIIGLSGLALVAAFADPIFLRFSGRNQALPEDEAAKRFSLVQFIALLVTGVALVCLFAIVPLYATDLKDVELYQNWLQDLQRNGLFDVYNHSTSLNYLPLILYILEFYNFINAPFGLNGDAYTMKLFFSLPIFINLYVLWRIGRQGIRHMGWGLRNKENQAVSLLTTDKPESVHPSSFIPHPSSFLLLVGLSPILIFNAALWGQTDTLLACMLVWTLLAVQSERPYLAGVLLGLDWAMKPQSWVVAPLFALLLLRDYGWRKTLVAGGIGLALLVGLSAPAFGFDFESFRQFLFQPNFAGEFNAGSANAYNLLYLLGFGTKEAPTWLALGGFAIIGLVYLAIGWWVWQRKPKPGSARDWAGENLAAGLILIVFFLCAIKMRERYVEYGLFFAGIAAFHAGIRARGRGILLAFLAMDLFAILNQLAVFVVHRNSRDYNTVFFWHDLILAGWMPGLAAIGFSAAFVYLLQLFLRTSPTNN